MSGLYDSIDNHGDFIGVWEAYLKNLKIVLNRKLETRRKRRRDDFKPLIKDTFDTLLKKDALDEVEIEAANLDVRALSLYRNELEIFNTAIEDDDYDLDEAVDDGEEAKGSAEKLFSKLPKWVKDVLKVLNELIKIIRGG